jgi:antitoxin component of RelBE/YafQ-DinJ toxin-antitoxin module
MNTATISITTTPETKAEAQALAQARGMSLSKLLENYLKRLTRTKKEEPSAYLIKALKESEEDVKAGRVSPTFDNVEDSIAWLNDKDASYENGDKVHR